MASPATSIAKTVNPPRKASKTSVKEESIESVESRGSTMRKTTLEVFFAFPVIMKNSTNMDT
jgi:hypothetical protein